MQWLSTQLYLLDFSDAAKSVSDSYPDIITFANKDPAGSRKNPDNYAFFTLSYWYWQKRKYSHDDDSGDLAGDAQPGIKYHFADGTAIEKVIKG